LGGPEFKTLEIFQHEIRGKHMGLFLAQMARRNHGSFTGFIFFIFFFMGVWDYSTGTMGHLLGSFDDQQSFLAF
jgi:hypothetical protein